MVPGSLEDVLRHKKSRRAVLNLDGRKHSEETDKIAPRDVIVQADRILNARVDTRRAYGIAEYYAKNDFSKYAYARSQLRHQAMETIAFDYWKVINGICSETYLACDRDGAQKDTVIVELVRYENEVSCSGDFKYWPNGEKCHYGAVRTFKVCTTWWRSVYEKGCATILTPEKDRALCLHKAEIPSIVDRPAFRILYARPSNGFNVRLTSGILVIRDGEKLVSDTESKLRKLLKRLDKSESSS